MVDERWSFSWKDLKVLEMRQPASNCAPEIFGNSVHTSINCLNILLDPSTTEKELLQLSLLLGRYTAKMILYFMWTGCFFCLNALLYFLLKYKERMHQRNICKIKRKSFLHEKMKSQLKTFDFKDIYLAFLVHSLWRDNEKQRRRANKFQKSQHDCKTEKRQFF